MILLKKIFRFLKKTLPSEKNQLIMETFTIITLTFSTLICASLALWFIDFNRAKTFITHANLQIMAIRYKSSSDESTRLKYESAFQESKKSLGDLRLPERLNDYNLDIKDRAMFPRPIFFMKAKVEVICKELNIPH
jgi:hypothetical protein